MNWEGFGNDYIKGTFPTFFWR